MAMCGSGVPPDGRTAIETKVVSLNCLDEIGLRSGRKRHTGTENQPIELLLLAEFGIFLRHTCGAPA